MKGDWAGIFGHPVSLRPLRRHQKDWDIGEAYFRAIYSIKSIEGKMRKILLKFDKVDRNRENESFNLR